MKQNIGINIGINQLELKENPMMSFQISHKKFEPLNRIEFGFILLPDDDVMQKLYAIGKNVQNTLSHLPEISLPAYWGAYKNQAVRIPHLSIGQSSRRENYFPRPLTPMSFG